LDIKNNKLKNKEDFTENSISELHNNGITIIPEFFTEEFCENSTKDIENAILEHSDKMIINKSDGTGGDIRFFKFENQFESADILFKNEKINSIVKKYASKDVICHFIVAGKVEAQDGRRTNSGGGWHRDSDREQIKVMVYLNKVDNDNGPFQFIKESRINDAKRQNKVQFNFGTLKKILLGIPIKDPRYSDESIENEIFKNKYKIDQIEGQKGTVIIFDGSYVHRGKNINKGLRYTYTMYFYPNTKKYLKYTQERFGKIFLQKVHKKT
tara:strand:+ start:922 stop:1728 length:807 start_codon:yes stop_codon:yes gene_type:complete